MARTALSEQGAQCCAERVVILCADWSKEPRKRAAWVALPTGGWRIARRAPPGAGWTLNALVELGRRLRDEHAAAVLLGIDAVLGVPAAFARAAGTAGFLATLRWLSSTGGLEQESKSPSVWRPERPFFRVPAGAGGLSGFIDAAGGRGCVFREIELRTGAKPVFALSGIPGSVGSGSREVWRELVKLLSAPGRALQVWPFDGSLAELTAAGELVLAEAYPRAAYAVALEAALPAKLRPLAKSVAAVRADALGQLERCEWARVHGVSFGDLEAARENDDDFDALMTAAALLRLVAEGRPLCCERVDPGVEGGILATGGVDLPGPPSFYPEVPGVDPSAE